MNGLANTIGGLHGQQGGNLTDSGGAATLTINEGTSSTTFAGVITGNVALTMTRGSTGTLTLSGR